MPLKKFPLRNIHIGGQASDPWNTRYHYPMGLVVSVTP
jgi:hypothetical protein